MAKDPDAFVRALGGANLPLAARCAVEAPVSRETVEDLRRYQLHLVDHGTSPVSLNAAIAGLKFFYLQTLGYDWPLFTKKKCASRGRSAYPTSAAMPIAAA